VITVCTTEFCLQSICVFCIILKVNNIIQLVFVMEMQCLLYAAGNEFVNIVQMYLKLQKVKIMFSSVKLRTALHKFSYANTEARQQNNQRCIYEISIRTSQPLISIVPSSLVQPPLVLILSLGHWLKCLLQIFSNSCNIFFAQCERLYFTVIQNNS
jgi:hypothetical protein